MHLTYHSETPTRSRPISTECGKKKRGLTPGKKERGGTAPTLVSSSVAQYPPSTPPGGRTAEEKEPRVSRTRFHTVARKRFGKEERASPAAGFIHCIATAFAGNTGGGKRKVFDNKKRRRGRSNEKGVTRQHRPIQSSFSYKPASSEKKRKGRGYQRGKKKREGEGNGPVFCSFPCITKIRYPSQAGGKRRKKTQEEEGERMTPSSFSA